MKLFSNIFLCTNLCTNKNKKHLTYGILIGMKRHIKAYVFVAVVILAGIFLLNLQSGTAEPVYESVSVARGDVFHDVSVTGHVEPVTRVTLAFSSGGRIQNMFVEEGARVTKDSLISILDSDVAQSTLREAEARLAGEHARLRDVLAPLRGEEKALKDAVVVNAEQALSRAEESARAVLTKAYVYADDAIHEKADELFESKNAQDPSVGVTFRYSTTKYFLKTTSSVETDLNTKRSVIEGKLQDMKERAVDTTVSVDEALTATSKDLLYISDFLTQLAEMVNKYSSENTIDQSVYETFQASVTSARTAVSTVRSEVLTTNTAYTTAEASLSLALRDLELSVAGASDELVEAQEAAVAVAQAGVDVASKRASDTTLRAPLEGVISKIYPEVGEVVSPYEQVAELITDGTFEVEAYIPEADIARIKLGDKAEITFDAYEKSEVFEAEVVRVALSETERDGVPTYKTTLRLFDIEREGVQLRPGMTADIEIRTDVHENVLYVPVRSVLRKGSRTYVQVYTDGEFIEKDIQTGLRGSEGSIEVLKGLSEGEEIVLYVEEA